jgi:hypothetical protein
LARFDLKEYARRGAQARVAELSAELAEIYRAFPDLRGTRATRPAAGDAGTAAPRARKTRKRRPMNAAQRKAVSERMRRYWAARKKAKGAAAK